MNNKFMPAWSVKRLWLFTWAGLGAFYSCCYVPLVALAAFIPGTTFLYCAAETVWWWNQRRKCNRLSAVPPPGLCSVQRAWELFHQVMDSMQATGVSAYDWVRQWFKGAEPSVIGAEDVAELLACTIWGATRDQVATAGYAVDLYQMVDLLEAQCSIPAPRITISSAPQLAKGFSSAPFSCRDTPDLAAPRGLSAHCLDAESDLDSDVLDMDMTPSSQSASSITSSSSEDLSACAASLASCPASSTSLSSDGALQLASDAAPSWECQLQPDCLPDSAQGGFKFAQGSNVDVSFYKHMQEPVPHWWRPLAAYAGFEFMGWMNHNMLTWAGFKCYKHDNIHYYAFNTTPSHAASAAGKQSESAASAGISQQPPIVLLHGVGMGLLPYINFALALASTGAPLIAVEYKHVGQRWCKHVPDTDELVETVLGIMDAHGCGGDPRGAHIVAHSYGTAVASSLLQTRPSAVASLSLMDPICFHMWYPSLLVNFIYRPMRFFAPSHLGLSKAKTSSAASESEPAASGMLLYAASWLFSLMPNQGLKLTSLPRLDELMKDILLMGPAREMHCSAALCRGMDWRTVSLWPSTVNQVNKCLISLSAKDELMPALMIEKWARANTNAVVQVAQGLRHADILLGGCAHDQLVADIIAMAYGGAPSK